MQLSPLLTLQFSSQAKLETTAAEAQLEAPNATVAHQVEHNAEQVEAAAKQAALAASVEFPKPLEVIHKHFS